MPSNIRLVVNCAGVEVVLHVAIVTPIVIVTIPGQIRLVVKCAGVEVVLHVTLLDREELGTKTMSYVLHKSRMSYVCKSTGLPLAHRHDAQPNPPGRHLRRRRGRLARHSVGQRCTW